MRKLLFLLLLAPLFTLAQAPTSDSTKLTAPPTVTSFTPSSWYQRGGNASNAQIGYFNSLTGKWGQLVTGYQFNHYTGASTQAQINALSGINTIYTGDGVVTGFRTVDIGTNHLFRIVDAPSGSGLILSNFGGNSVGLRATNISGGYGSYYDGIEQQTEFGYAHASGKLSSIKIYDTIGTSHKMAVIDQEYHKGLENDSTSIDTSKYTNWSLVNKQWVQGQISAAVGTPVNIYNSNGTLTGNRLVNTSTNSLAFYNGTQQFSFSFADTTSAHVTALIGDYTNYASVFNVTKDFLALARSHDFGVNAKYQGLIVGYDGFYTNGLFGFRDDFNHSGAQYFGKINVANMNDSTLVFKKYVDSLVAASGGGSGTVTNIATGYGTLGGPITTTGTISADSTALQTVANFFPKGDTRYLKTSTAGSTYALQSTTISAGYGMSGGGSLAANRTLTADSSLLVTKTFAARYPLKSTTIAGFDLRNNITLASLTPGNGLVGSAYNGSTAQGLRADTAVLQTVLNFFPKGDTRYGRLLSPLSQFASTTSSQFFGVISDETGSGSVVGSISPTFTGTLNAAAGTFTGTVLAGQIGSNGLAFGTVGLSNFVSYASNIGASTATPLYLPTVGGSIMYRNAFAGSTSTISLTSANNYANVIVGSSGVTTAASGTHPVVTNLLVKAPVITSGGATTTNGSSLYIDGAPSGATNNYALQVVSGNSIFGGPVTSNANGIANSTTTLGFVLKNTIAAIAGQTLQYPSVLNWSGNVWNTTATAASNQFDWAMQATAVSAATPTTSLVWRSSLVTGTTASYTDRMSIDNSGNLNILTGNLNLAASNGNLTGNNITITGSSLNINLPLKITNPSYTSFDFNAGSTAGQVSSPMFAWKANLWTGSANADRSFLIYDAASTTVALAHEWQLWANTTNSNAITGGVNALAVNQAGVVRLPLLTSNGIAILTGGNGAIQTAPSGTTTLTAGVSTITITGLTTSGRAKLTFKSIGGTVSTTWQYAAVCTSNTLTVTALTNAGTTDTTDSSTLYYSIDAF